MTQNNLLHHEKILILGAGGAVATMMVEFLSHMGWSDIVGVDVYDKPDHKLKAFIQHDLMGAAVLPPEITISQFDMIVFALPFDCFETVFSSISKDLKDDVVLVDVFSIKSPFLDVVRKQEAELKKVFSLVSLNPLFRPDAVVAHKKILICVAHNNSLSDLLVSAFKTQAEIIVLENIEQHDKLMGIAQVGPHYAVLSLALFIVNSGVPYEALESVNTAFMEGMLAVVSRILVGHPHVYWDIQSKNKEAKLTRAQLVNAANEIADLVESDDADAFSALFDKLQHYFQDREAYNKKFLKVIEA